ncbi:YqhR family membrane protein [Paenibacillus sp. VCA1]|uniref:YqhR family membrane protein n=1 Tax=Paenibacillus sp. VCA1 TaxID=3039148 RepID=UPI00287257AF|nr:YqhR family membrane protein [Paenibacillus sp. VCA1]MDR9852715.1 YqhR family membrane protein [Paenibacillus sp. VCA1]
MTFDASAIRQKPQKGPTNPFAFSVELGFFAGFIWGAIHWLFHTLHFTKVIPGFLGRPFFNDTFLKSGAGQLAGWLFFIALSVIASVIYGMLFRKLRGPWPGIVYGIVWWCVIFAAAGPALNMVTPLNRLGWNSITSEFCLFLLWGLFIGYTVAFEFTDERKREPK